MSEFEEELARAVQEGLARSGLPGAADALRRGRRRSLRARGGAAVLGVAAVGGALGVGSTFGSGPGRVSAAVSSTTGSSASAPASSTESAKVSPHGDGLLAAKLWPGYDLVHWVPKLSNPPGPVKSVSSLVTHCYPSTVTPSQIPRFPVTGTNMWANGYDTTHHAEAIETVYTFGDEAEASAFLVDARHAGTAPACGSGSSTPVPKPGVSTDYGTSWLVLQQNSGVRNLPSDSHNYLVRSGNRVAFLMTNQFGTAFTSTADDIKVLADMREALEK